MKTVLLTAVFFFWSENLTAQNLLANGEFDLDTMGWFAFTNISWVSDDGASLSGNGSMLNTGTLNNNSSYPAISDKFLVKAGYWYLSGASYKVPSSSPVPWVWYRIYWYDGLDVEIGQSNQVAADFGVPNDVWENLASMSQAPANAVSGEMRIYFQTGEPSNPDLPFGLWDDVYVFEETVFINNFD